MTTLEEQTQFVREINSKTTLPLDEKESWPTDEVKAALEEHENAKRLAFFIMGCLVQQQVVELGKCHSDVMSDFEIGLSIITECLRGNLIEGDLPHLPFDWSCD